MRYVLLKQIHLGRDRTRVVIVLQDRDDSGWNNFSISLAVSFETFDALSIL